MSNLKILLAVMALTAVPVANVAAQQVIMMPLLSQEVAMVNVTGDSNYCKPGTYVSKKTSQAVFQLLRRSHQLRQPLVIHPLLSTIKEEPGD